MAMNLLLLEIIKGQWLISAEHASKLLPTVMAVLEGKQIEDKKPNFVFHISPENGGAGKTISIKSDTWLENPDNIFDNVEPGSRVLIPVNGVLTKYDNCGYYGAQTYAKVIDQARENKNITGVILKVDGPGGTADGSFDFSNAVKEFAAVKPIVAFVDGMAASAHYRSIAFATKIVAKPGSILGSIGTMTEWVDRKEMFQKWGIKVSEIYATASTEKNQESRAAEDGDFTLIREKILDPINNIFLQEMRDARNLPDQALTGRIYFPEEAIKDGLIDEIGTLKNAFEAIPKQKKSAKNSSTNMKLGQSILSFLGLKEQPEQLTDEQLQQLEQLAGENIRISNELKQKTEAATTLQSQIDTLTTEVTNLTTERDNLQTEVEALGKKPGAQHSTVTGKKDATVNPEQKDEQGYWDRKHQRAKESQTTL